MALMSVPEEAKLLPPVGTLLRAIPLSARAIVVGPPGSGKTVLAVHLARRAASTQPTDLLVASEHLVQWVRQALADVPNVRISNWRTWIGQEYADATRGPLPREVRDGHHGFRWSALERAFAKLGRSERTIVVDEAQDVPAALVRILARRAQGMLAFADPVQRFANEGSAVEDLVDAVAADDPWPVFVLEEDYRTTRAIQAFATAAWVPERERIARPARRDGPPPTVRSGGAPLVVEEVRRWLDDPAVETLVVATAQTERATLLESLTQAGIDVARRPHVDDARVRVLAFEALRGLEFDAVVLAPPSEARDAVSVHRANLYVAATRARHGLSVVVPEPTPPHLRDDLDRAEDRYVGGSA
jgi:hypothetical protein